jgi:hypothetical protein
MVRLIDPKRQAELEEIIVKISTDVDSLSRTVKVLENQNVRLVERVQMLSRKSDVLERSLLEMNSHYRIPTHPLDTSTLEGGLNKYGYRGVPRYNPSRSNTGMSIEDFPFTWDNSCDV